MATGVLLSGSSHEVSIISVNKKRTFQDEKWPILATSSWLHCGGAVGTVPGSLLLRLRFLGVAGGSSPLLTPGRVSMTDVAVTGPAFGTVTVVVAIRRS